MAVITLTIPDAILARVVDGICTNFAYQANIVTIGGNSIPNPESKGTFAKRMIVENAITWIANAEGRTALVTAEALAKSQITIT